MNKKKTIGYLGIEGSYSHTAAVRYNQNNKLASYSTFRKLIEDVKTGKLDCGVIPVENSVSGSVVKNYDLLLSHKISIVGEIYLRVNHHLLANAEVPITKIKTIYSHPEAFNQCDRFLLNLKAQTVISSDTASAAKFIANRKRNEEAAIGSLESAMRYRLSVLASNIETHKKNFTRFAIVSKKVKPAKLKEGKATVVFALHHKPGTLVHALDTMAKHNVNLTKIESRPILGSPFEYRFIVDFEYDMIVKAQKTIKELGKHTLSLTVLGLYPKASHL